MGREQQTKKRQQLDGHIDGMEKYNPFGNSSLWKINLLTLSLMLKLQLPSFNCFGKEALNIFLRDSWTLQTPNR